MKKYSLIGLLFLSCLAFAPDISWGDEVSTSPSSNQAQTPGGEAAKDPAAALKEIEKLQVVKAKLSERRQATVAKKKIADAKVEEWKNSDESHRLDNEKIAIEAKRPEQETACRGGTFNSADEAAAADRRCAAVADPFDERVTKFNEDLTQFDEHLAEFTQAADDLATEEEDLGKQIEEIDMHIDQLKKLASKNIPSKIKMNPCFPDCAASGDRANQSRCWQTCWDGASKFKGAVDLPHETNSFYNPPDAPPRPRTYEDAIKAYKQSGVAANELYHAKTTAPPPPSLNH